VLNPIDSGELYFVADGRGGHIFAESLDEHNRNVAKWRVIERTEETKLTLASPSDAAGSTGPAAVTPSQELPTAPPASIESTETSTIVNEPAARLEAPETPAVSVQSSSPEPEAFEPGSVLKVAGKLIPIPAPRPKLQ
jgi:UPF0755 protein